MKHFFLSLMFISWSSVGVAQFVLQSTLPGTLAVNSEFQFDVRIFKGNAGNFSKYQIDVPPGVVVAEVDTKGAAFSFERQRAKLIWVNTPAAPEFTVRLKLLVTAAVGSQGFIHQKYLYIQNEAKLELEEGPLPVVFVNKGSAPSGAPSTAPSLPDEPGAKKAGAAPTALKEPKPQQAAVAVTAAIQPSLAPVITSDELVYRVQLASAAEKPNLAKYTGLSDLQVVREAGVYKILVGRFARKEEAVQYKNALSAKGFQGFVVTYRNGERLK